MADNRCITHQVITCIKQSSWVKTANGEIAYLGATSPELYDKLGIKPSQLYRAVSSLCKQGKLVKMCRGLYNINQTSRQWEVREDFFDDCLKDMIRHRQGT